jgi:putative hydrolase of the HAD superfamily
MKIKAVAFDIDGTLYPSYKMYIYSIPIFIKYPRFIYNFSKVRKSIRKLDKIDNFRKTQAELLAKRLKASPERVYNKLESIIYNEWEKIFKWIKPYPGVLKTLEILKQQGLKLAALSDFPVELKLKYLGLEGLWDCAFSSEEIAYLKPHSKSFQILCEKLNLEPSEILYVGDTYLYDIVGAYNAGLKTAFLTNNVRKRKYADFQFSSYRTFNQKIYELFN